MPPLTLMGSEVDVLKLRSSLEIFLKVSSNSPVGFRTCSAEILESLKMNGVGDMELLVD